MGRRAFFLGAVLAAVPLGLGIVTWAASFGDGPSGPFPGGALGGVRAGGANADWEAASAQETVEVQVGRERPRSVLACLLLLEGEPYLSVTLAPFKGWHETALADGRVIVRLDGKLYERRVERVADRATHAALRAAAFAKYESYEFGDGWAGRNLEFLRLLP